MMFPFKLYLLFSVCLTFGFVSAVYYLKTIAGNDIEVGNFDDEATATVTLEHPKGLWKDTNNNLLFVESSTRTIRKLSPEGAITTIIGGEEEPKSSPVKVPGDATAREGLHSLYGDGEGNVYFAGLNYFVWKYNIMSDTLERYAGATPGSGAQAGDGEKATSASLNRPAGLFLSSLGVLYIADSSNHRVRCVDPTTKIIDTFAGNGLADSKGDEGPATLASINLPQGVWGNSFGALFIAEFHGNRVRKVDAEGIISGFAGTGIVDTSSKISERNEIPATLAHLSGPTEIKGDTKGNIYIAEALACRIRMVSMATKLMITIIGTGYCSPSSTALQEVDHTTTISDISGLWIDNDSSIYFSESKSNYIRKLIKMNGSVRTHSDKKKTPSPLRASLPSAVLLLIFMFC